MSDRKHKDCPSFNLFTSDWLAGTMAMTYEEKGLYIDLLALQWENGHLPPDARLRRLRVPKSVLNEILEKFPVGEDGLRRNARLEDERDKQRKRREGLSKGARETNAKRWGNKSEGENPAPTPTPAKKNDAPKAPRKAQPIDDAYLLSLKPTYHYADVEREFAKAQRWCEAQSPPVTLSRQRLVNWLNRIPPPPSVNGKPKAQPESFFEGYQRQ
jgi:uncharacterized protein YdaU (DUF1376 family)